MLNNRHLKRWRHTLLKCEQERPQQPTTQEDKEMGHCCNNAASPHSPHSCRPRFEPVYQSRFPRLIRVLWRTLCAWEMKRRLPRTIAVTQSNFIFQAAIVMYKWLSRFVPDGCESGWRDCAWALVFVGFRKRISWFLILESQADAGSAYHYHSLRRFDSQEHPPQATTEEDKELSYHVLLLLLRFCDTGKLLPHSPYHCCPQFVSISSNNTTSLPHSRQSCSPSFEPLCQSRFCVSFVSWEGPCARWRWNGGCQGQLQWGNVRPGRVVSHQSVLNVRKLHPNWVVTRSQVLEYLERQIDGWILRMRCVPQNFWRMFLTFATPRFICTKVFSWIREAHDRFPFQKYDWKIQYATNFRKYSFHFISFQYTSIPPVNLDVLPFWKPWATNYRIQTCCRGASTGGSCERWAGDGERKGLAELVVSFQLRSGIYVGGNRVASAGNPPGNFASRKTIFQKKHPFEGHGFLGPFEFHDFVILWNCAKDLFVCLRGVWVFLWTGTLASLHQPWSNPGDPADGRLETWWNTRALSKSTNFVRNLVRPRRRQAQPVTHFVVGVRCGCLGGTGGSQWEQIFASFILYIKHFHTLWMCRVLACSIPQNNSSLV